MTLKHYLITMAVATFACFSGWLILLFTINPETTNWLGFALFYVSLFLTLIGSSAIVGFVIRFLALKKKLAFKSVRDAFRQSFLFSFLIISILFLLSNNLLNWINLILLVVGLTVFEFFLISYSSSRPAVEIEKNNL